MAERIRSILFNEHRANAVAVSLKLDANSFSAGSVPASSWSSNVWIYIFCAVALCGTVAAGLTKQSSFPRTPQDVLHQISKWTGSHSAGSTAKWNGGGGDGHGVSIKGTADRELTVSTASPTKNSAEEFLLKTFQDLGTPSFITTKYIKSLRDDHVTSIERLRNFDDADWRRHGVKQGHIAVLRRKLMEDGDDENDGDGDRGNAQSAGDEEEDDDELSFDDDTDGWNGGGNDKGDGNGLQNENNESTTDFDDF